MVVCVCVVAGSGAERLADVGYGPGDLGIVPRPSSRLPTRRDGMRRLQTAQRRQAQLLIGELATKPTDPTTTSLTRVSITTFSVLYNHLVDSVREYVFFVFFPDFKKHDFLRFLK